MASSAQTVFVRDLALFLTEPHTGQHVSANSRLQCFAVNMCVIRKRGIEKKQVDIIDTDENLSLAPDPEERGRLADWRFNPSLVAPLIGALWLIHNALSRVECLHLVCLL